ncbi:MAG TPA: MTH938/NDUFAF3 family protein [Rudaea sp.]|nr:MTH938/NDUFAF3 family protein [Rudaea sp.]
MQLTEHRHERELFLRHADADYVTVVDRRFDHSIVVGVDGVIEDFAPRTVAELDGAAIARVLSLEPAVVLLGTGARAVFPPAAIAAEFLKRGIGIETMDNAAAARTFNVLVAEGRRVVAVFLL